MKPDMNEEDITGFHVQLHFGSDNFSCKKLSSKGL